MTDPAPTRGFTGRPRPSSDRARRLPPGQYDTGSSFPVLTVERTPAVRLDDWTFRVEGHVAEPRSWTWPQVQQLPGSTYAGDIHCVTTWSKFDTSFGGVSLDALLDEVELLPGASHVMAFSSTGYTTNLPLDDVRGGKAWLVWEHEGRPLPVEHGGPVRLLVPHLYFWKSAKWVAGLRLMDHDEPGFWEQNGYHDRGDPWREQRYAGD